MSMDRCNCWKKTQVTITIEHCPSVNQDIGKEIDRIIHFTMKETGLTRFGKVNVSTILREDEDK